jgi:catechol 2,3-dioxygenase-like lactoylglutathione lyase family enzyme
MRINVTSVLVDDQDKALEFYTEVLGFLTNDRSTPRRAPLAHRCFSR